MTRPNHSTHGFEQALEIYAADLQWGCRLGDALPWAEFWLNPRRLRGSDFLMRWSQGIWSEDRMVRAIQKTGRYVARAYGPSGTAPNDDVRAFELYFERLDAANPQSLKRPDLLVFRTENASQADDLIREIGGECELPFVSEHDDRMRRLVELATVAIECENSLWIARQMPWFDRAPRPQRRLNGRLGHSKSAVLPTIIVKEEDRARLRAWQTDLGKTIYVWHSFYDLAFGISFDENERLISDGDIEGSIQVFQAPGGATTRKTIYKTPYHFAYLLGESTESPTLVADSITDKNGHILPYVRFQGGEIRITPQAISTLDAIG